LLRSEVIGVPVVVVGNLTVGGTGKTPLVAALVAELNRRGWRAGIVLRGYGGRQRGPLRVAIDATPADVGDEAVLLARITGAAVAIGVDRVAAARLLTVRGDCDLVVADDGLQHWRLARDLEILLIDGRRRFGNGRWLPAGPLRESAERRATVDHVVCNGGVPQAGEVPMQVLGHRALPLGPGGVPMALASLRGRRVHAVAGIGNPQRFFDLLRSSGIDVDAHALADHHRFRGDEIRFDDDAPVLITEKDAVKCAAFAHDRLFVVPVEASLPPEWYDRIHTQLHEIRARAHDPR
jgi:tetraacyldisaccharide 4'-kinase